MYATLLLVKFRVGLVYKNFSLGDIDRWAKIVMKRVNSIEEKMTTRLKTMLAIHPSDDVQFQLHVKHKGKLFDTEHDNRCLKLKHSGNK